MNAEIDFLRKKAAYQQFEHYLSSHAKAEEESLYVHMKKKNSQLRVEGLEGHTEHGIADSLMGEIDAIKSDEDHWTAKVKVLAELVQHHIKEEEQEVLKKVSKDYSTSEVLDLGLLYSRLLKSYQGNLGYSPNSKKPNHYSLVHNA